MRASLSFFWFLVVSQVSFSVFAKPSLRAVRLQGLPPTIDGRLGEAAWQQAPSSSEFTQKFPFPGQSPSETTHVRVLYDDQAIYVGIECEQQLLPVVRRLTRRDRDIEADFITVSLDSRRDGTTAFEFSVNAAGVLRDSIRFNDTEISTDWDEIWEGAATVTPSGWSAELRIPLRSLRFDTLAIQDFGLQVRRYISLRQETDEWAYIPPTEGGEVSRYGRLTSLKALRRSGRLELRPFLVARARWIDLDLDGPDLRFGGIAGLDLKLRLTQNLVLDATFNPDFGQVEPDQLVLNLTTFEVLYPEKRPFFLEGIDTFSTPFQLFYTRRVGTPPEAPTLLDVPPFGERLLQAPSPSTIYGAVKLMGTLGRRLTIGAFSAVLGRNSVPIEGAHHIRSDRLAEPLKLQNVVRLKVALGANAHVGFTGTAVIRLEQANDALVIQSGMAGLAQKLCPDGSIRIFAERCFHDAYIASIDGRWRSRGGDYSLNAQALLSAIVGSPPRMLRDGTIVSSGDISPGAYLRAAKDGGEHFVASVESQVLGQKVNYNDLGYMARQNEFRLVAVAEFRTMKPWRSTLETHTRIQFIDRENLSGLNLARQYQINSQIKFRNFWSLLTTLEYRGSYFDDREIGDGTALERTDLVGFELRGLSDTRLKVFGDLCIQAQFFRSGFNLDIEGTFLFRLLPQLDVQLLPLVYFSFGEPRYVGAGAQPGDLVFGTLQASNLGAIVRATYTFSPRLTLQFYGQFFLAARHYEAFFSYHTGTEGQRPAIHLSELQPTLAPSTNPDTLEPALNLSAVLRWEYVPGSVLFVVYTRSQTPPWAARAGDVAGLDFGTFRAGPGSNVLLIKWTHWYD